MSRWTWDDFQSRLIDIGDGHVFTRRAGSGPPLLLLQGFPQTHLMWRPVAPRLADRFTVVCADLPGYGRSGCPASRADHTPYAKRTLARAMVAAMRELGFERFSVAGHDRGGRVGYRLALDHPDRLHRLVLLDVVATVDAWKRADKRFATGFWPWSLLVQPEPLPERLITAAPDAVIDAALGGWGTPAETFGADARATYIEMLRDPARVHAICEEYRAAATCDDEHDAEDRRLGRRIGCPVLVLWSSAGPLGTWYVGEGGPSRFGGAGRTT